MCAGFSSQPVRTLSGRRRPSPQRFWPGSQGAVKDVAAWADKKVERRPALLRLLFEFLPAHAASGSRLLHGVLCLRMALKITKSFRMEATTATIFFLPDSIKR